MVNALLIHPDDSVLVALADLPAGSTLETQPPLEATVATTEPIPFGHKVAIRRVAAGQQVTKYGESIGLATQDIEPGGHVHTHNLTSVRGAAQT